MYCFPLLVKCVGLIFLDMNAYNNKILSYSSLTHSQIVYKFDLGEIRVFEKSSPFTKLTLLGVFWYSFYYIQRMFYSCVLFCQMKQLCFKYYLQSKILCNVYTAFAVGNDAVYPASLLAKQHALAKLIHVIPSHQIFKFSVNIIIVKFSVSINIIIVVIALKTF